ncbi:MAG: histidine phosphatase family protein [Oscillospiraceae bacterium]
MRNYKIHFIRQGLTDANIEGRYIGRTDEPLSESGFQQLEYLMENCSYPFVSKVYCSPLLRCEQTAEIIYPTTEIKMVNELIEMDMGDFEGCTAEELTDNEAYKKWLKDAINNPPPNGEDAEAFLLRLVGGIREIVADMMQNSIFEAAIITHGGAIMTLLSAMGLPKAPMEHWQCPAGGGFTVYVTAAMWMRDNAFEVSDFVPHGIELLID